ncbi:MAG: hypothetical protein GY867_07385, partial [bacterium]|nr:hypothetical protein [bacterium]
MSERDSASRGFVNSLLASHYLLPVSSIVLFLILGAALYTVYMDTRFMRDQINEGFNQQQLLLARQAAWQISGALEDIQTEIGRRAQELGNRLAADEGTTLVYNPSDYARTKGLIQYKVMTDDGTVRDYPSLEPSEDTLADQWVWNYHGAKPCRRELILCLFMLEKDAEGLDFVTGHMCSPAWVKDSVWGLLFAKIDVTGLVRQATENIRSGHTGYAWVIDPDGMFLYHPDKEFIGKNAFTARQEREPYISFNEINEIMRGRMLKGEEGTGSYISGWHRGIQAEMTKLLAFGPVTSK